MRARVAPLKRLPIDKAVFDYLVKPTDEKKIRPGQLVTIPFRQKDDFGLVVDLTGGDEKVPETKLKEIKEIIFKQPALSVEQTDFCREVAAFYQTPLSFVLKTNLLPLKKKKLASLDGKLSSLPKHKRRFEKPNVFIYSGEKEKKTYLEKNWPASGQVLFLVPEISQIKTTMSVLPEKIRMKAICIGGETSDKKIFDDWLRVRNEKNAVVVGTRRAFFLPWTNLAAIFFDDEGNPDHKSWDMAPRLHGRDAALFLAKSHGAKLHLISHTPSVETKFLAEQKIYQAEKNEVNIFPKKEITIIDRRQERKRGNYGEISEDLLAEMKRFKDGDVFLFINRRGAANHVFCRDCGFIYKCQTCRLPLTYYDREKKLRCHFCKTNEAGPTVCRGCGGVNLAFAGPGTAGVIDELNRLDLNNQYDIQRLDSESGQPTAETKKQKIIVGTEFAWARLDWKKIKIAAFLDADLPLFAPEYKAAENLWQALRSASYLTPDGTKIFVQTSDLEHSVYRGLSRPEIFYQEQWRERKTFGYPPFRYMLKLFAGFPSPAMATAEAEKTRARVLALTAGLKDVKIGNPLEARPQLFRQLYWRIILIKIGLENYKKNIKQILGGLPENWKADPNPNDLLTIA